MRRELVPESYDASQRAEAAATTGVVLTDSKGHKKRVRCPEMKYNKFQMYDLKEGGGSTTSGGFANHSSASSEPRGRGAHDPGGGGGGGIGVGGGGIDGEGRGGSRRGRGNDSSPDKSPVHLHHTVEADVKDIKRYLRSLLQRIHVKEERGKLALEWRIVALVLDRFFFYCYLTAIVVSLATIFPKTY